MIYGLIVGLTFISLLLEIEEEKEDDEEPAVAAHTLAGTGIGTIEGVCGGGGGDGNSEEQDEEEEDDEKPR